MELVTSDKGNEPENPVGAYPQFGNNLETEQHGFHLPFDSILL